MQIEDFTQATGATLPDEFDVESASPIDYFWLLFKPEMFESMTRNTNNYARWKMEQSGVLDKYWTETSASELRSYVGINILMGISSLPEADMYWSKNVYIGNQGIQNIMTCNRYQKLGQYFHVSDRATEPAKGQPGYDKLYKVRPIIEHVQGTFPSAYSLSREIAVDEAMVKYTGRLGFRQYMPAKPIKRGIKIWMLCDSNNAYLSRFDIYLGRQDNRTELGLGYNVVTKLTDNLHNTYRHVYFDNYFTGVPLMQNLLGNGLYACGTVRVNRKQFPKELKKPRDVKNRGDYKIMQKGDTNLTATVWKDKKLVYHLTTLSEPTEEADAQRRAGQNILQLKQPLSVASYNKFMGGVDVHDQYRMKYDVGRNCKKWWRYLFWFMVNCACVNAFILYKATSRRTTKKKRFAHLDFRLELVRDIIGGYSKRKRSGVEVGDIGLVDAENIQGHIHGRLNGPGRRCRYHQKYLHTRRETVYGCTVCQVHLCKDGCHAHFHNLRH